MVFSSMTFLAFFLPAVIGLYFISQNPKWRNGVLVVFSLLNVVVKTRKPAQTQL